MMYLKIICSESPRNYWLKTPGEEVLPEKKNSGGVRSPSKNPNPIYDQNLRHSLPYS